MQYKSGTTYIVTTYIVTTNIVTTNIVTTNIVTSYIVTTYKVTTSNNCRKDYSVQTNALREWIRYLLKVTRIIPIGSLLLV